MLEHNRPHSELTTIRQGRDKNQVRILAKNQTKTKLAAIDKELDELQAAGVNLAPNITAQALLIAEEAGLVIDFETGFAVGSDTDRYNVTDQGRRLAL